MSKTREWARILISVVGGWWSLMSGALSIPLAFLAMIFGGKAGMWFAILSYMALWIVVFKTAYRNYKLEFSNRLSDDAVELLAQAVKDGGRITHIEGFGGTSIGTPHRQFVEAANPRSIARWESAIAELVRAGYADGLDGYFHKLTIKGYKENDRQNDKKRILRK